MVGVSLYHVRRSIYNLISLVPCFNAHLLSKIPNLIRLFRSIRGTTQGQSPRRLEKLMFLHFKEIKKSRLEKDSFFSRLLLHAVEKSTFLIITPAMQRDKRTEPIIMRLSGKNTSEIIPTQHLQEVIFLISHNGNNLKKKLLSCPLEQFYRTKI